VIEMERKLKRGDQVMVSPDISGPASGRLGFASGNKVDGHYEILDRSPDQPRPQVLGYIEPDYLWVPLVPPDRRQVR
jgi:hypothetical protein